LVFPECWEKCIRKFMGGVQFRPFTERYILSEVSFKFYGMVSVMAERGGSNSKEVACSPEGLLIVDL
jgi:hypothetical protein